MPSALVIGGAEHVLDDVQSALKLFQPDAYFVINDMIPRWELRCDYAVTLHPDKMPTWLNRRRNNGWSDPGEIWSHKSGAPCIQRTTPDWAGSSGLLAVKIAMENDFDHIVLAGVPMVASANHVVRGQAWNAAQQFRSAWVKRKKDIAHCTRSMSGWTRELLGEPTHEWLEQQSVLA